jgi:hemerythrin superfamily protein
MTQPIDVIPVFHHAFRNDMQLIDAAALDAARGKAGLAVTVERFRFFNEVLVWHADGEEEAVFPRLEEVAPPLLSRMCKTTVVWTRHLTSWIDHILRKTL